MKKLCRLVTLVQNQLPCWKKRQAELEEKAMLMLDRQISRATSLLNKSIQNEVNNHENCFLEKEKLLDHTKQCISIIDKKSVTKYSPSFFKLLSFEKSPA
jgi:hypothetical protein